jgi:hypothetical protein
MGWLKSDKVQNEIAKVASKTLDPARFMRLCHLVAYKTPKLQECSRDTIFKSILEASAMGWELGFDAHLVPFNNKGRMECQLIADYRGLRKSVMRGGNVLRMKAGVVYEGEEYVWKEGGAEDVFEYTPNVDAKGSLGSSLVQGRHLAVRGLPPVRGPSLRSCQPRLQQQPLPLEEVPGPDVGEDRPPQALQRHRAQRRGDDRGARG